MIPLLILVAARITQSCLASLLKNKADRRARKVSSNRARFGHYRYYTNILHSLYAGGGGGVSSVLMPPRVLGSGPKPCGGNITSPENPRMTQTRITVRSEGFV